MAKKKPTIKKMAAVREAVKALGLEAPAGAVKLWVKDTYKLDLTDATAQNYVHTARKEMREANGKPVAKPPQKATAAPVQAPQGSGMGLGVSEVVEAVGVLKGLVGKLGKSNLLKLVEAL